MYKMQFLVNGRWYTVVASDATLQDMCMGEHVRQRQIQKGEANDRRPALAHGELKGVTIRWPGRQAPFTRKEKAA